MKNHNISYINLKSIVHTLVIMRLIRPLGLSIASVMLFSMLTYSQVYSSEEEYVDVLIGFTEEVDESEIIEEGGDVKYDFTSIEVVAASIPEDAIEELVLDPNIAFIEYDAPVFALGHTSSIAEYSNSWGVDHIQADKVHVSGNKGSGIRICILDTGIDYNHSDLAANYKGGKDFINNDNDPKDDNGHGSHVAGIAAAVLNGAGVVGVAPQAHLIIGKVLNGAGTGNISDVIAGIEWCVDNDAQIISMSLGSPTGSIAWKAALDAAYSDGVLLVAAAGNSGKCDGTGSNVVYPAKYPSVIAVTATTMENDRLINAFCPHPLFNTGSSTGPQVELSAPGDNIRSAWLNGAFRTLDGTSMATAHVSGSAALVWLTDEIIWAPQGYTNGDGVWSNGEIRTVLDRTAQDLGVDGRDRKYGYGLVRPDLVTSDVASSMVTKFFGSFTANVIAQIGCDTAENKLKAKGMFSLDSNNINLLREHVTVIIGPFELTIPGGSFKDKDNIVFRGEIDNIKTTMIIKDLGNDEFKFKFIAHSLDLSWLSGDPVLVKLGIDDLGKTVVTPQIVDNCA